MQVFPPRAHTRSRSLLKFTSGLWKNPTRRTVLVIGGAGYIGSALLPKLLQRGHRVRLLDRLFYGTEPLRAVVNHPQLEIVQADFRQLDRVVECMQGVDAVIHLGAIVGELAVVVALVGYRYSLYLHH